MENTFSQVLAIEQEAQHILQRAQEEAARIREQAEREAPKVQEEILAAAQEEDLDGSKALILQVKKVFMNESGQRAAKSFSVNPAAPNISPAPNKKLRSNRYAIGWFATVSNRVSALYPSGYDG